MLIGRQIFMWQFLVVTIFWKDTKPGTKNSPSNSLVNARGELRKPMI